MHYNKTDAASGNQVMRDPKPEIRQLFESWIAKVCLEILELNQTGYRTQWSRFSNLYCLRPEPYLHKRHWFATDDSDLKNQ